MSDPGGRDRAGDSDDHDQNQIIDLNTADESTLAGLAMVGPEKAHLLVKHRPYENWREVEKIPGIGGGMVDVLAHAGVQIGKNRVPRAAVD